MTRPTNAYHLSIPSELNPLLSYEKQLMVRVEDQVKNKIVGDVQQERKQKQGQQPTEKIRCQFLSWLFKEFKPKISRYHPILKSIR